MELQHCQLSRYHRHISQVFVSHIINTFFQSGVVTKSTPQFHLNVEELKSAVPSHTKNWNPFPSQQTAETTLFIHSMSTTVKRKHKVDYNESPRTIFFTGVRSLHMASNLLCNMVILTAHLVITKWVSRNTVTQYSLNYDSSCSSSKVRQTLIVSIWRSDSQNNLYCTIGHQGISLAQQSRSTINQLWTQ